MEGYQNLRQHRRSIQEAQGTQEAVAEPNANHHIVEPFQHSEELPASEKHAPQLKETREANAQRNKVEIVCRAVGQSQAKSRLGFSNLACYGAGRCRCG